MAIQIGCINKEDRYNSREAITHVGGVNPDGTRWKFTQQRAIQAIENNEYKFYVERPSGDIVWVVVAVSAAGNKYLKTEGDGDEPNNLLSLPECI